MPSRTTDCIIVTVSRSYERSDCAYVNMWLLDKRCSATRDWSTLLCLYFELII
jgi:hypothetical protein